ncbi:MAG TPA: MobF family relaxase [Trebonia sp.]
MPEVSIGKGTDVDYYLDQVTTAGANYYLDAGEPPGIWAGRAAEALDLRGKVHPDTMRALYHHSVGPDGVPLGRAQKDAKYGGKRSWEEIEARIKERIDELGPVFVTPAKVREIRNSERSLARSAVPYYDMTFSAEKSVSLAWASARVAAKLAREQTLTGSEQTGEQDRPRSPEAARWEKLAAQVEQAVMAGADAMLAYVQDRGGAIVRTGHHSSVSGEWRDATGFVAAKFIQHTSRSNDPQLHVQIPILNKGQREDQGDEKWRNLDGTHLWKLRLGAAAHAGVAEAQALARMGLPLVKRADGNGYEIGGVNQATIDAFSKRSAVITKKIAEWVAEYEEIYGRPPTRATLYKHRKAITVQTRKAKSKPRKDGPGPSEADAEAAEERLAQWVEQAEAEEVQGLETLWDAFDAYDAEHPEAKPSSLPSESEREEIIRAAVAEVQRQNAAWSRAQLEWELFRQLPVLPAATDWAAYLDALADDALANRIESANVLQIGHVPDVINTARLGLRLDGTSIFRKPNEDRYTTAEHLDREEWILRIARTPVPQLISWDAAEAALADSNLDFDQRAAAMGLLTAAELVTSLVAPAGAGKTTVMGPLSRAHMAETGCRVIGLTLSQNASHEMAKAGVAEAWNIARFFKRGVPVYAGDLLIVDEASQVGTTDLARIMQVAAAAGARVILTGDPEQLGPVEAGGMFPLVSAETAAWELTEVHRFRQAWEAAASLRVRRGDMAAWIEYGSRGLVKEGPQDRVYDQAADTYVLDTRQNKSALLITASNAEAAKLAALVRARRIEYGEIPAASEVTLSDGNDAGTGDLVRARLNCRIEAAGRTLDNRDTIRIEGWTGQGDQREAIAVRRDADLPGGWSERFTVPVSYLRESSELDYAGNVHVAQGRTVDVQTIVVGEGTDRHLLYVGMTRGRERNRAYVVTGPADPNDWSREERDAFRRRAFLEAVELQKAGASVDEWQARMAEPMPEHERARERQPWEAVISAAMARENGPLSAIETMRAAHRLPTHAAHLHTLKQAFWWRDVVPKIDQMVKERIPEREFNRYLKDPERPALLQFLREHEIGGHRITDLLDRITRQGFGGANSIAGVLHGRLGKAEAPSRGQTESWAQRTPEEASPEIRAVDEDAAAHQAELGDQLAEEPPHWALEAWGVPPQEPGPLLDDWKQRAGLVGMYREQAGITDPEIAIGPAPARQADLTEGFAGAVRALALADDAALMKAMGRGDLEAEIRGYERAQAVSPPDARPAMETNDAALEYAVRQAEDAAAAGDPELAQSAAALQGVLGAERDRLRVADSARREWEEAHADQAALAGEARDELRRRRTPRLGGEERQAAAETTTAKTQPGQAAEAEQSVAHVDPEMYAAQKTAQSARVEADMQARRETGMRQLAEIDPELARLAYPDLPTPTDRTAAELAALDRGLGEFRAAQQAVANAHAQKSSRRAQHELHEEAVRKRDQNLSPEAEADEPPRRPVMRPPHLDRRADGPTLGM